ncbi:hypothetical protein HDU67_007976 [Dinochytrium kinnereticum]|nr:hypothetical protein HDU67_007976 [Dinochytrium kinnereticum]
MREALSLYREALRTIRTYPGPRHHRQKLARNVREVLEVYSNETSPMKVSELIAGGYEDIKVVRAIACLNNEKEGLVFKAAGMTVDKKDLEMPGPAGWKVKDFAFGFCQSSR